MALLKLVARHTHHYTNPWGPGLLRLNVHVEKADRLFFPLQ
jgi:hypothetical protein